MLKTTENGLIIKVKIVPNSSRNEIILEEEFIKVKVTAQPIENTQDENKKTNIISQLTK